MDDRELMEQTLTNLELKPNKTPNVIKLIETLREELAPKDPVPVAWITAESNMALKNGGNSKGVVFVHAKQSRMAKIPLYAHPKREWKKLTSDQVLALTEWYITTSPQIKKVIDIIEQRIREKNE